MSKTKNISEFTLDVVANAHRCWIRDNQKANLIHLYGYLMSVEKDFDCYDDDALLVDHIGELTKAGRHYVRQFENIDFDDGDPITFLYRREFLIEDIDHVQDLIEEAGASFAISKLVPFARLDELPVE